MNEALSLQGQVEVTQSWVSLLILLLPCLLFWWVLFEPLKQLLVGLFLKLRSTGYIGSKGLYLVCFRSFALAGSGQQFPLNQLTILMGKMPALKANAWLRNPGRALWLTWLCSRQDGSLPFYDLEHQRGGKTQGILLQTKLFRQQAVLIFYWQENDQWQERRETLRLNKEVYEPFHNQFKLELNN